MRLKVEEDYCPNCGYPLDFSRDSEFGDEGGIYFVCSCPSCRFEGEAHYDMPFKGYFDVQKMEWRLKGDNVFGSEKG